MCEPLGAVTLRTSIDGLIGDGATDLFNQTRGSTDTGAGGRRAARDIIKLSRRPSAVTVCDHYERREPKANQLV